MLCTLRSQHLLAVAVQHVKQITFALQDYTVSAWYQYSDIYTMALSTTLVPSSMAVRVTIFLSSLLLYFHLSAGLLFVVSLTSLHKTPTNVSLSCGLSL